MTVATTNTRQLDIDAIVLRAAQRAGILGLNASAASSNWSNVGSYGRDVLEMFSKSIQAQGVFARNMELYPLTVVDGTASYALPADTINVVDQASYLLDTTTAAVPIMPMGRDEYVAIPDKTVSGTPSRYWLDRGRVVTLYFDLVPAAGAVCTLQRYTLVADSNQPNTTADFDDYFTETLFHKLAYEFGVQAKMSVERLMMLKTDFKEALASAKSYAKPDGDGQMVPCHSTPWSR